LAGAPAPQRPEAWRDDLLSVLEELGASFHEQHRSSGRRDSLLSEVKAEAPHLLASVNELLEREGRLAEEIDGLVRVLADVSRLMPVDGVRKQLADIALELRELRAWETDIVYEAYAVDLGVGD
jgi:ATP phosphoribosyltransferase regulatory subunit HisZ